MYYYYINGKERERDRKNGREMKARVHNIHRFLEEYPLEATQKQKLVCELYICQPC